MLLNTIFTNNLRILLVQLLVLLICNVQILNAQNSYSSDVKVIASKDFHKNLVVHHRRSFFFVSEKKFYKYNPVSLAFGGLMYVYQNVVSEQIAADCPYEISCSGFGRLSIKKFGLIKGLALAADRVTRCTKSAAKDLNDLNFNDNRKIIDTPEDYSFRK